MTACDFGSGSGGWVLPLSHELKAGMVYAVDVLESAVSALNGKISSEQIFNIKTIQADVEKGISIKDAYFDLVLMTNLLFQVENRDFVMKEARRVLKPSGMVLIIDWNKDAPIGSTGGRLSLEEAVLLGENNGFRKGKEIPCGSFHWGVLLIKI